jgi:hypothetical protein
MHALCSRLRTTGLVCYPRKARRQERLIHAAAHAAPRHRRLYAAQRTGAPVEGQGFQPCQKEAGATRLPLRGILRGMWSRFTRAKALP